MSSSNKRQRLDDAVSEDVVTVVDLATNSLQDTDSIGVAQRPGPSTDNTSVPTSNPIVEGFL